MRRILALAFILACAAPLAPAQGVQPEKIFSGVTSHQPAGAVRTNGNNP